MLSYIFISFKFCCPSECTLLNPFVSELATCCSKCPSKKPCQFDKQVHIKTDWSVINLNDYLYRTWCVNNTTLILYPTSDRSLTYILYYLALTLNNWISTRGLFQLQLQFNDWSTRHFDVVNLAKKKKTWKVSQKTLGCFKLILMSRQEFVFYWGFSVK